ncbi:MAG: choice-of-anchor A family protein, partial [Lachnospiraceae bacterium]
MKKMKKNSSTKAKWMLATRIVSILSILLMIVFCMHSSQAEGITFHSINLLNSEKQLTTPYTAQNQFGGSQYSSVAFDFHIFAEEVTLNCHTNGNIATNTLHANYQAFGAKQTNYLGKREDNYIGEFAEKITNINSSGNIVLGKNVSTKIESTKDRLFIGENSNILDNAASSRVYQETVTSSPYINISSELNKLCHISQVFSQKETSSDVILSKPSGEQQSLTVTQSGGNHYLNIPAKEISSGGSKRVLSITLPSYTTLIINVDMKNASIQSLANLVVSLNGYHNGEQVISEYCGVLWNLYDSSNNSRLFVTSEYANVGTSDYFFGTILAPSANIRYGALNGSVIAKKTYQDGKESHRFDFTGYEDAEEPTTETPSSEATTETPSSEATTEIPSSEATTETPSSEATTETPSSEATT